MDNFDPALGQARLFQGVAPGQLQAALAGSSQLTLPGGTLLLDPARGNSEIFIVLAGEVLVCLEPDPANPLVRLGAGDCVGELSIIDEQPPSAYVLTAGECRLLAIPQAVIWRVLAEHQAAAFNLLRILSQRIRENNAVILSSLELRRDQIRSVETDAVTGLRTRAWADDVFPRQLELSERIGQHLSLLILDVDYFARLNDFYGQAAGDESLRHVGRAVARNLRLNDLCARYGGDEIAVLMPATEGARARLTAERLRGAIAAAALRLPDGLNLSMTVSGGVAEWQPGQSFETLRAAAEAALKKAKQQGRNQTAVAPRPA